MDSEYQVDYQLLNYLSTVDHNLCCPICRSPLVNPVYTTCLHTFCSACISTALERSQTCPVDRTPLHTEDVSPAPIMIANLVNELVVLCPNSERGCSFTCARYLVEAHISHDCDFAYVQCRECDGQVLRKDAGKECLHQLDECKHCFQQIRKIDLEEHDKECPEQQGECPHCNLEIKKLELREHESTCDEATISCSSSSLGCPWTGKRKELTLHQTACPFTFLRPVLQAHAERLTKLELENRSLRKRIEQLAPRNQNTTTEPLSFDEQAYQFLTEQEHMRQDMERLSATLGELEIKQGMLLMNESLRTKEELAGIRAAINGIRMQIHWLLTVRVHGLENRRVVAGSGGGGGTPGNASGPSRPVEDTGSRRPNETFGQGVKL